MDISLVELTLSVNIYGALIFLLAPVMLFADYIVGIPALIEETHH